MESGCQVTMPPIDVYGNSRKFPCSVAEEALPQPESLPTSIAALNAEPLAGAVIETPALPFDDSQALSRPNSPLPDLPLGEAADSQFFCSSVRCWSWLSCKDVEIYLLLGKFSWSGDGDLVQLPSILLVDSTADGRMLLMVVSCLVSGKLINAAALVCWQHIGAGCSRLLPGGGLVLDVNGSCCWSFEERKFAVRPEAEALFGTALDCSDELLNYFLVPLVPVMEAQLLDKQCSVSYSGLYEH
ncbi:hypothetical protein Nepgr_030100 [Nepenthes gracilis]|uniref:Uncharacterized protein n=1 Tax=Nepenthes gracilis TaxID=150966 RepID=A0AAD3Y3L9_NEPGR|nr:hypothetical protein Nepgr_030100 [Nepenthes gracilis]